MRVLGLTASVIALSLLCARTAAAVTYLFATRIAGDTVPTSVMLTDTQFGDAVDITISIPAGQGDLLGFFGNVTPETLVPQLRIECSGVVTQFQANTNKVSKVGPGNVMTPVGTWDFGVRLGQNGSGGGAITTATFRIRAPGLTVASLTGASTQGFVFGVRIQSTLGAEG